AGPVGWGGVAVAGLVGGTAEPVAHGRARPGPCPGARPAGGVGGGGVGQELPDRPDGGAVQVVMTVTTQPVQRTSDLDRWADQGTAGPDDHDLGAVGVQRPAAVAAAGRAGRGAQRDLAGAVGRRRGGDQDVGDRGGPVAVAAKPRGRVVGHHGVPPGSSWPLRCEGAWESGWERAGAMSEGSWTWLIVRCWLASWVQRALQLVQRAIGYRPKVMVTRADRHSGQRGMRSLLWSLVGGVGRRQRGRAAAAPL